MLSDPGFAEEFDIAVDEITDEYLQNELRRDERKRVQKYFLRSNERRNKLEFAAELLRRAESNRRKKAARPGALEQIAAFWRQPSFAPGPILATVVVIVAGLVLYQVWSARSTNYLTRNLAISTAERADGPEAQKITLSRNTGLKFTLTIPESARGANKYSARLAGGNELQIEQQTPETVTVIIPAGSITPGTYAIQLSKVKPDGTKERIPGSYYFAVE